MKNKKGMLQRVQIMTALQSRGVKVQDGTMPEYHKSAPDGFEEGGVFYTLESGEVVRLARTLDAAIVEARQGSKSWGGIIGTRGSEDVKNKKSAGAMTTGQKVANFVAVILAPPLMGTTVGALEDAGWKKTATATRVGLVAAGAGAQASDNPVVNNMGLMAMGGVGYELGRKYLGPLAAMVMPKDKSEGEAAEDAAIHQMRQAVVQQSLLKDGKASPELTSAIQNQINAATAPLLEQQTLILEQLARLAAPQINKVTLPAPEADETQASLSELVQTDEKVPVPVPVPSQPTQGA